MEILDSLFPVQVPITFPVVIFLTSPLLTKEAKKYQVEELREWFKYLEVIP